ncbi:MAG: ATP-binding protein [Nanoarchaeota archaeon]|nr:ATP-binding protein [Nanoarchaeota archaeon]
MIGRDDEIKLIETAIGKAYNILVTGPIGVGKHELLEEIKSRHINSFYLFEPTLSKNFLALFAKELGYYSVADKTKLVNEIEKRINDSDKTIFLFINNLQDITKQDIKIILRLAKTRKVIVIASCVDKLQSKELSWIFKEEVKLKPFEKKYAEQLILEKVKLDKNQLRQAWFKTKGMPLAISDFTNDLNHSREDFDQIKQHPCTEARRVDLFPIIGFIALAYMMLALRYIAILGDSRQLYIMAGASGFIMLSFIRLSGRRNKNGH